MISEEKEVEPEDVTDEDRNVEDRLRFSLCIFSLTQISDKKILVSFK